jgi:hypothetical protein
MPGTSTAADSRSEYVCSLRLVALVDALSEIDGSLDVGLNYSEFTALVRRTSVAYARVRWNVVTGGCLGVVAVSAERAFNKYLNARKIWGNCLASAALNCTSGSVGAQLQRHWSSAHTNLRRAVNNLDN